MAPTYVNNGDEPWIESYTDADGTEAVLEVYPAGVVVADAPPTEAFTEVEA